MQFKSVFKVEKTSTREKIASYLEEIDVEMHIDDFIPRISNIYHYFEAASYDQRQTGVFDKNKYFQQALQSIESGLSDQIQVLDFGCGTGFAALEMLKKFGKRISKLVCFDLSPDMVAKCKEKIDRDYPDMDVVYLSNLESIDKLNDYNFDLIITNAVLHHLMDLDRHFKLIDSLLKDNGFYIIGHEPNNLFYQNKDLILHTKKFQKFKRVIKKANFSYLLQKLGLKNPPPSIERQTNQALFEKGLIKQQIPISKIRKLVDIHVPNGIDKDQPWGFLGFSPEIITNNFLPNYTLKDHITHTHIKDDYALRYAYWRKVDQQLAEKYPNDGAIAIMTFQK